MPTWPIGLSHTNRTFRKQTNSCWDSHKCGCGIAHARARTTQDETLQGGVHLDGFCQCLSCDIAHARAKTIQGETLQGGRRIPGAQGPGLRAITGTRVWRLSGCEPAMVLRQSPAGCEPDMVLSGCKVLSGMGPGRRGDRLVAMKMATK